MTQTAQSSRLRVSAYAGIGLPLVFLCLLAVLHFIEPEIDPSWRLISEYQLGRYGWLMSVAFLALAGGAFAVDVLIWRTVCTRSGRIGRVWLLAIVAALIGGALFKTDPNVPGTPATLAGRIHAECGLVVIGTFPIVATLISRGVSRNPAWAAVRRWLFWATTLVWIGLAVFIIGTVIAHTKLPPDYGDFGPKVMVGWENRFMMLCYSIWFMAVSTPTGDRDLDAAVQVPGNAARRSPV
jgi:hypothetical protein